MSAYVYNTANAIFIDDNYSKINININDELIELSVGDYIEFKRNEVITQAKILDFGWNASSEYANRIFYLPWRTKENKWADTRTPKRGIPLEFPFFHNYELGDWSTIKKINIIHNNIVHNNVFITSSVHNNID